jgi:hypothetical protein
MPQVHVCLSSSGSNATLVVIGAIDDGARRVPRRYPAQFGLARGGKLNLALEIGDFPPLVAEHRVTAMTS